jgi:hypothetical protein
MRGFARSIVVLGVVGALVSAQQARAESVFTESGRCRVAGPTVLPLVLTNAGSPAGRAVALDFLALRGDTVETVGIEVEKEKGPGLGKQIAVFAIVAAAVGYAVFVLMKSDDEPAKTSSSGKPLPGSSAGLSVAVPFTR